ncbi:hypothetical protein ACPWSR_09115 [Alloiococcus sp. CFN-8]|uniref:hypothetical protein n=1 Tax=Alloiococcus sp. CFN-8 TaxID=3416081 RepID=UPI003CE73268
MNNDKYKEAFDKLAISKDFRERTLSHIKEGKIENRDIYKGGVTMKKAVSYGIIAATLIIALGMTLFLKGNNDDTEIALKESTGKVKVSYVASEDVPETIQGGEASGSLIFLTEEEIVNDYNSSILSGTVQDIKNILIDFGDGMTEYRAIATVSVDKAIKGEEKPGDKVDILLPTGIALDGSEKVTIEDTYVIAKLKVGMKGIFMPIRYTEDDYLEQYDSKLFLKELAEYGLMDGMRFAILESSNGEIINSAFSGITSNSTLEEVEEYIKSLMK